MIKINFKKIIIRDIEGREIEADFSKQIGNQLYMQGQNIEECELGKKIYFAEAEISLNTEEQAIIKKAISSYSYIARSSIEESIECKG